MVTVLDPVRLGDLELPNRAVMASLGRCRSDDDRAPPPALVGTYYAQRATAGIIFTEACSVSPMSVSRPGSSGVYTEKQAEAWRAIARRVHASGGRMFQQLYHLGRKSDPSRMPAGAIPVAPSAIAARGTIPGLNGPVPFATPRALEAEEIPGIVAEFHAAATNARAAGMDGIEVHGANGYLIDEFIRDGTNRRTDGYGGSPANRARFLLEITEAAIGVFGVERVGVRISPHLTVDGIHDSDLEATYGHVAAALDDLGVAYLHLIEAPVPGTPHSPQDRPLLPLLRDRFVNRIIVNASYDLARANAVIASGLADIVSFGTLYIANPDLVERFRRNGPYNAPDPSTYFGGGTKGYTDYPALDAPMMAAG